MRKLKSDVQGTNLKERWSSGGQTNGRRENRLKLNI